MAFKLKASRVLAMIVFFWLVCLILLVSQLLRFCLVGWDFSIDLLVRFIRSVFHSITWIVFQDLSCYVFFTSSNKKMFRFTSFCRFFNILHEIFLIAALIFSAGYYCARIFFTSSNFFSLHHFAAFSTFCVKSF